MKKIHFYRTTAVCLLLCILALSSRNASGQTPTNNNQPIYYKLKSIYLPPEMRPEVRYSLTQLGFKSTGGDLPKTDGQQFQVNVFNMVIGSKDESARTLTNMMNALQTHLAPGRDLRMSVSVTTAAADQKAQAAGQTAAQAQTLANNAVHRVDVLTDAVSNLDNYKIVSETSVHFGFDKDFLTQQAKDELDKMASAVPNTKGYIITVEGGTDSVGPADYNYSLSERRADSVIQYLSSKYNIPAHKIYLIGLGKDKPVEPNKTREGRAANRRVDIRLMTNTAGATQQPAATPAPPSM